MLGKKIGETVYFNVETMEYQKNLMDFEDVEKGDKIFVLTVVGVKECTEKDLSVSFKDVAQE